MSNVYGRILEDNFQETPLGTTVNMRIDPIEREIYARFSDGTEKKLTGTGTGIVNAQNGLSLPIASTVELGGTLIKNTTIVGTGYGMQYTNTAISSLGTNDAFYTYPTGAKQGLVFIPSKKSLLIGTATSSQWDNISGLDSSIISGYNTDIIIGSSYLGTIASGFFNSIQGNHIASIISGSSNNASNSSYSIISGLGNTTNNLFQSSIISGGSNNIFQSENSIIGGISNTFGSPYSSFSNLIGSGFSTYGGSSGSIAFSLLSGRNHIAESVNNTILSGYNNRLRLTDNSVIAGMNNLGGSLYSSGNNYGNFGYSLIVGRDNLAFNESSTQYGTSSFGMSVIYGDRNYVSTNYPVSGVVVDNLYNTTGNTNPVPVANNIGGVSNLSINIFNSIISGRQNNINASGLATRYSTSNLIVATASLLSNSSNISINSTTAGFVQDSNYSSISSSQQSKIESSTNSSIISSSGVASGGGFLTLLNSNNVSVLGVASASALSWIIGNTITDNNSVFFENIKSVLPGGGMRLISPDGLITRTLTIDNTGALPTNVIPSLSGTYLPLSGGTMTGDLILFGTTSNPNGAINKSYVDNLFTGIRWKEPVLCRTTADITLSGNAFTIDGVSINNGDRVLVMNQLDQTTNGIYVVNSGGAWSRSEDANTSTEIISSTVYVQSGNLYAGSVFTNTNVVLILGASNINYVQTSGAGSYTNGTGLNLAGNVFSIDSTVTTLTGTQILTNKTLTSPIINVGSDATGDIYYRNISGNFTRLGIGSDGQVLKVNTGLPSWQNETTTTAGGTTGMVQYNNAGGFAGATNLYYDNGNGRVGIGITTPTALMTISNSGATTLPATILSDVLVHTGNQSNVPTRLMFDTYNNSSTFGSAIFGRRSRGNITTQNGINNGDTMLFLAGLGHNSSAFQSVSGVSIELQASENWSTIATGSQIHFNTTNNGTTSSTRKITIHNNGDLELLTGSLLGQATQNIFNTVTTTANILGASTAITMGATTGTMTLRNPTIVGSQTTQALFNTVATTINFAGASTTLNIGNTSTATKTMTLFDGATVNGATKTLNIGTGGVAGSVTNINIGSSAGGGTTTLNNNTVIPTGRNLTARITPRTGTVASSATPTINTDNVDYFSITALTVDITSMTTNLSGTPTAGQKLWISITGTATRNIAWGALFEASTIPLPTATVSTNRLDVGFIWNEATSKWRCVGSA